ncbi:hypothetical protein AeMF1_008991 [Aphanomyces euteiches]|nr:hypothetical protein AeMF1_008991 [Aphanomyces euteiches]KAH9131337.1 hypothetical protein AeNC1_019705 [Aphanomyces euteiches]
MKLHVEEKIASGCISSKSTQVERNLKIIGSRDYENEQTPISRNSPPSGESQAFPKHLGELPLDPLADVIQDFLTTVAAWKKQEEKLKNRREILTCNTSYDPPPITPQVCFTNSIDSLPGDFGLLEGEQLGFWKKSDSNDIPKSEQAFLKAFIFNQPAKILADTGANLSVIHRRLADSLKLNIDSSKKIGINGLGPNSISTFGMVKIKLTIGNGIVFIFSLAVCDIGQVDFDLILGMDFTSKAGFIINTTSREIQLPDGDFVPLLTHGVKYETTFLSYVKLRYTIELGADESMIIELPKYEVLPTSGIEYWVDRSKRWIPTVLGNKNDVPYAYKTTNVSNRLLTLSAGTIVGAVAETGVRPLNSSMIRVSSNRYKDWQTEVWEGSVSYKTQRMLNQFRAFQQAFEPPAVPKPKYRRPTKIMKRSDLESIPEISVTGVSTPFIDSEIQSNKEYENSQETTEVDGPENLGKSCLQPSPSTKSSLPTLSSTKSVFTKATEGVVSWFVNNKSISSHEEECMNSGEQIQRLSGCPEIQSKSDNHENQKTPTFQSFAYTADDIHRDLCCPSIFSLDSVPEVDQTHFQPEVILHEAIDMTTEEMSNQLAMIPEVSIDLPPFDITELDIGEMWFI